MGFIKIKQKGNFNKTSSYLERIKNISDREKAIIQFADDGLRALQAATPVDSGRTKSCWIYEIKRFGTTIRITYRNTYMVKGIPIAIILQYGHGTGTGGYVEGIDYVNPAIRPIFERIANEAWKEVTRV